MRRPNVCSRWWFPSAYLINRLYLVIALLPPASMTRRRRYRKKATIKLTMIAFVEKGGVGWRITLRSGLSLTCFSSFFIVLTAEVVLSVAPTSDSCPCDPSKNGRRAEQLTQTTVTPGTEQTGMVVVSVAAVSEVVGTETATSGGLEEFNKWAPLNGKQHRERSGPGGLIAMTVISVLQCCGIGAKEHFACTGQTWRGCDCGGACIRACVRECMKNPRK